MKRELEKNYNPKAVEERTYQKWLDKNYFHAEIDKSKEPYTIVIPPPNITGRLHMGHAMDNTIQDILIRFKRMQGYCALWVPGCDHASISTEVKIVEKMTQEGVTKEDIGREEFLKRAWAWKEEYGGTITQQLKKLGSSLDWERERFTMDEGLSRAVLTFFTNLYEKGLIYKGEKIVNWCPKCQTTISDAEVNHIDKDGKLWYVNYPLKEGGGHLQIATTRPETMLGDTCLAVNPKDERYTDYIGKTAILPIMNKELPIIADEYVEMEFGTGVVKITPAHDPNDFDIAERHDIEKINIMNDDGTLNENAGKYKGYEALAAREAIVKELEEQGLLVKIEDLNHAVGVHERCNVVVEPMIKMQWFVKMTDLAKPAIDVYKNGELRIVPERYGKVYLNWLENIRDWCISRQLWWGHRIPAYYCDCGEIVVSATAPEKCPKCGATHLAQDEDTLDTWFSSGLWPFSTLGWPDQTEEMEYFYPTNVLVTGYDIIFFWVVRMVFSALECTNQIPFKDVLLHGLIRDPQGRKFSKSLGNGVDPLEIIDQYGADALRLMLVSGSSPGNDMRFYIERVEACRNFSNKLWNASRFVLMNLDEEIDAMPPAELTPADQWILSKANALTKEVTQNLENYDFGLASQKVHEFLWEEYCDWYIEMVKPRLYNKEDQTRRAALYTLRKVLIDTLKLLHPFMPFITEEIFLCLQSKEETIMLSQWPEYDEAMSFPQMEKEIDLLKSAIRSIRNIRSEMNVPHAKKTKIFVVSEDDKVLEIFKNGRVFFETLANASETVLTKDKAEAGEKCVSAVVDGATLYLPLDELVDKEKELVRLGKEKEKLEKEIQRVEGKLSNEGFVAKAPQKLIEEEKEKKEKYSQMLKKVLEQIEALG